MEVGGQYHTLVALRPRKVRYPLYGRLDGPQGCSGQVWKILLPLGFNPRTVRPIASHCTDWAILAHHLGCSGIKVHLIGINLYEDELYVVKMCMYMQVHKHMRYSVYENSNGSGNLTIKYVVHHCHRPENVDAHVLKDNQYDVDVLAS
jgi:hypothetical protein